jgi:hypothetical protein
MVVGALGLAGCGSSGPEPAMGGNDGGSEAFVTFFPDSAAEAESGTAPHADAGSRESAAPLDDRFITKVISFQEGTCAGFGASSMPEIVQGPPVGAGTDLGSTDVVSLGGGGSIVVSFEPNAIVDGPGVDFIVFENPFYISGNPNDIYAEPGEVSVSDDGVTWTSFPCTQTTQSPPYGQCGGVHPVFSNPLNGISPFDPTVAGGDAYDLADIGVPHARYVRIVNIVASEPCPASGPKPTKNGFDLDAIAIVHGER